MTFNSGSQLDPSRVQDTRSRGGGRGVAIGGGLGGILVLILGIIFGPQAVSGLVNGTEADQNTMVVGTNGAAIDSCTTGTSANERDDCRIVGTLQSLDGYWRDEGAGHLGVVWTRPDANIFSGSVTTACGYATSASGPFYCPGDDTIYIDPTFYAELVSNYGADSGHLAQMYVIAHEYGHHIQNLTGAIKNAQVGSGSQGGSVRVELQADCYAGVWANHAASTADSSGHRLIEPLTQKDIASALSAAQAVGDDRIQQQATGQVSPDTWTHGSSAQREAWFIAGDNSGNPGSCDTFSATNLNNPAS